MKRCGYRRKYGSVSCKEIMSMFSAVDDSGDYLFNPLLTSESCLLQGESTLKLILLWFGLRRSRSRR